MVLALGIALWLGEKMPNGDPDQGWWDMFEEQAALAAEKKEAEENSLPKTTVQLAMEDLGIDADEDDGDSWAIWRN